jgi:pimeloyl-ACP methyl ester carboxylesterase
MTPAIERFRQAEQQLWLSTVGALPTEHFVQLPQLQARVRLLEYGHGPTLLFVHGGPNAASTWLPLIRLLSDFRCVLLERPGCGLSEPVARPARRVRTQVVQLVADALAALDVPPMAVVASSFGSYCTLAYAVAHPDRIAQMIHLGCPALVPGMGMPLPFLLQSLPLVGRLARLLEPAGPAATQRSFRRMGHPAALDGQAGIATLMDWYTVLSQDTATQINDRTLFGRIRRGDALTVAELRQLQLPLSFFWGEADTFGNARVARALVATLPNARLELVPASGHLPWLDAPERAAAHVREALAA